MQHTIKEPQSDAVHTVDLGVSGGLNWAAKNLVLNKYLVDTAVADHGAAMLARDLYDGGYGPHEPMPFLHRVIPFLHAAERAGNHSYGLVPTSNTIGCSWKWRHKSLDQDEVQRRVEELTDTEALADNTLNTATYAWIKPLGLFTPEEGKNRVDFFREEQVKAIPAKIYERTYPSADRIMIYNVEKSGFAETWAVLDGRWVEKVSNPSWTLPLMEAYGVRVGARWPSHFPDPEQVQGALFEHRGDTSPLGNSEFGDKVVVDLETLRVRAEYQSEPIRTTVLKLKHAKIAPQTWMIAGAGFVVSCIALALAPDSWLAFKIAAGIALGASLSAGFVLAIAPILTTERRNVDNELPLPPELAPKYRARLGKRHLG